MLDETDHILEKDKIKDFHVFSTQIISHSFNDVELISNSSKNEVLLQSKECLQITCIAKFSLKIYSTFNFAAFHSGVKCPISTLLSNRVNVLKRW